MDKTTESSVPKRTALYIRVSTEEQVERYGIPLQKEALLSLIKSRSRLMGGDNAMVLAGEQYIYIDEGISGTIPVDERPAFSRLKEDIVNAPQGSKPFDMVAVFKIDRFARQLRILLNVIDFFEDYDIKFLSVNESIDTSTPFGKAILGIIGVIAELELETIKLRTQAGREQALKEGKAMGGSAAYGFIKNDEGRLERFEPEAKIVERIFDLFVREKRSTQYIASIFAKERILSPAASAVFHGKKKNANKITPNDFWRAERIMRILRDERFIGINYYNRWAKKGASRPQDEWKVSNYQLPQIIDPLTFEKAQRLLSSQKHERKNTHSNHVYLLSGLLKCDACRQHGVPDRAYWTGNRKKLRGGERFTYSYQCGRKNKTKSTIHCQTVPLPGEEIERYILDKALAIVGDPKGVYEYQQRLASSRFEIQHLQKRQKNLLGILNALPGQRDLIRQQHIEGIIDMKKLKSEDSAITERIKNLKSELDTVEKQLSQQVISDGYIKALEIFSRKYEGDLDEIGKDRNKAYEFLHSLIDSITIYSRPMLESDNIAGKKRAQQLMPNKIEITLRLPQEFLNENIIKNGSGQNAQYGGDGRNRTAV
jgi:site-specific DNA recombinase